jgi:hypothetical protein
MNWITRFLIIFAVLWLILWGLTSFAVPKLIGVVLPRLAGKFQGAGITLEELDFEEIKVSPSMVRLNISNVSARFDPLAETGRSHCRQFRSPVRCVRSTRKASF